MEWGCCQKGRVGEKVFIVHILALSDFAARDVFCCPRVAELPACVLSVAGAMRTGKSFLLDQMVSLFLASVLMEWSGIFYFRFAALHRAVEQGSLGEAGCRGTPVESTFALRSPLLPYSFPTGFPVSSSSFHSRLAFIFLNHLQPLIVERNGEQLAVFLMDTQVRSSRAKDISTRFSGNL